MNRHSCHSLLHQCVLSLLVILLSLSPVQAYWLDIVSDQAAHCHQMTADNTQNMEKPDCCTDHTEQLGCQHCTHCVTSILPSIALLPRMPISAALHTVSLSTALLSRAESVYRPPIL
jgi:hypothetical protein